MKFLKGRSVLVLGLGESGLAMARWCARCGADVAVWDSREAPPQLAALQSQLPAVRFFSGELPPEQLRDVHLVLKSPGLAPGDARIAPLLAAARATGVRIAGELDLFAHALADLKEERGYAPKVLAITGTNGKTTTTAMTALLVERAGKRVGMAGNIGPTMLDTLAGALDQEPLPATDEPVALVVEPEPSIAAEDALAAEEPVDGDVPSEPIPLADDDAPLQLAPPPPSAPVFEHLPDVWVLELSSFQLDGVQGFEPSAAAVLNLTQDHLDWHGSMAAYGAAKARIFGPAPDSKTVMVINRDDVAVEAMIPPPLVIKGARGRAAKPQHRKVLRFGLDAPQRPGDFGLVIENGMAWLVRALEADETIKRRKDEAEEIHLQRLMPADALRVRGRHNAANALAALALATAIGCPLAPMLHGLREYTGEPHRVEFIATVGGIEAFDDSKGTNVGATVAALDGLGADKAPGKLVVILGGDGKGQDFAPLAAPIVRHARAVALIGRDAGVIEAALAAGGVPMQRHQTLEGAVEWCFAQALAGDAVLLSPACASLDMFRNYAHRSEVFVQAVQARAHELGEAL
ncbi:UDP-N-acetylmuramoyl-L-alanine--D-glutamate ligase [Aquincola sp. S2]|uniref:UDP-N-acetylmuramoylalanine--D-glutamate ligase n=1 Tax=Pseudaquabacterium terrae TaxID=2732868 RepID=A0ABX2ESJ9_9BURK|nr:UDP-N-acetylmuramoyl-L-alanine--D-glutamate ligase [Aquabacterium terrae]NRF71519.1 UDP-N-acetylmuramoyl-L-alanine--D-glutamate ligase [Aquabacterium terrae]